MIVKNIIGLKKHITEIWRVTMFEIGYLTMKELGKNRHLNFLSKKGWHLSIININEQVKDHKKLDAIVIFEDTMSVTCHWLLELKKNVAVPIYLLSATNDSYSNIIYLQLGVQACFPVKMESEELFYTLTNLLTHYSDKSNQLTTTISDITSSKVIELVPRNIGALIDGETEVSLTKKEYKALEILYNNAGQTITYEELKKELWNSEKNIEDKNYRIANIIFHLRNKIEISTTNPGLIKTVRSKGYMLNIKK